MEAGLRSRHGRTPCSRGAEVEYLLNETEGHWFINPDSNIELYRRLERFLARHLGGRTTTLP